MKTIKCKNNFDEVVEIPVDKFFFRPSVYALITDGDKIITMKNKGNGKLWFPGGGVELGEKIEDALKREVKEETGLNIKVGKMVFYKENFFYYQPLDEAYHAFLFFFVCEVVGSKELILDKDVDDLESQKPRWRKINFIEKENLSDLGEDLYRIINQIRHKKD
jgi:ADP-ribose pyrophosphatase YjhB (NUDIX family)